MPVYVTVQVINGFTGFLIHIIRRVVYDIDKLPAQGWLKELCLIND